MSHREEIELLLIKAFVRGVLSVAAAGSTCPALAYGPAGHRAVGDLAAGLLCPPAAVSVAELTGGESLAEIGLWADRVRGDEAWRHTGPWHFMNIDDRERVEAFEHPPEGDVLWAIERHAERLAARGPVEQRAQALRFLVHFVVDVHQPLHVGQASDRGGNAVNVRFRGDEVNLHRFWDTEALEVAGMSTSDYTASLAPLVRMFARGGPHGTPTEWAAESLALRPQVYAFRPPRRGAASLDEAYLDAADVVTRVRLAQSAVRLAAMLNELLAPDARCMRAAEPRRASARPALRPAQRSGRVSVRYRSASSAAMHPDPADVTA